MAPKPGAVSISAKGSGPKPVLRPAVNRPVGRDDRKEAHLPGRQMLALL